MSALTKSQEKRFYRKYKKKEKRKKERQKQQEKTLKKMIYKKCRLSKKEYRLAKKYIPKQLKWWMRVVDCGFYYYFPKPVKWQSILLYYDSPEYYIKQNALEKDVKILVSECCSVLMSDLSDDKTGRCPDCGENCMIVEI